MKRLLILNNVAYDDESASISAFNTNNVIKLNYQKNQLNYERYVEKYLKWFG